VNGSLDQKFEYKNHYANFYGIFYISRNSTNPKSGYQPENLQAGSTRFTIPGTLKKITKKKI
jgi:hypothetical protein